MSWLRDLRRVRMGDVRSPLAGVLLLIFVLISWLIAIALVAGWIGSIVWMATAEGAGAAIVAFLVGVFVLLLLVPLATVLLYPLAAGIVGVVQSSIDRPADDEVVLAYTKSGRKPHILIDGTDNLALCGRECERRIRAEGVDPVDLCNTCWDRHVALSVR